MSLGSFSITEASSPIAALSEVLNINAVNSRGIRMTVISNFGFSRDVRFNEVAFGGSLDAVVPAVPIPSSGLLILAGLVTFGAVCARRRA